MELLLSVIFGFFGGLCIHFFQKKQHPILQHYTTEVDIHVSPHHLRKQMRKKDFSFTLVDLRSEEEFAKEHILSAINIPAYKDKNTSAYDEKERILSAFQALPKNKDIIVYCYSIPCMTGRKIGKLLAENGLYVKHLGIGWNEWRHHWKTWNHEHEWSEEVLEFVEK